MDLISILNILDGTDLTREVVDLKKYGKGISYVNHTGNSLTATVNSTNYEDLIKICIVTLEDTVKVYINNVARFKLTGMDLEDVSSFSIS